MSINYYVVDAFASRAFTGNPAAVCILDAPLTDNFLASIANEFNLSETAYLIKNGQDSWGLRWFTPACEVNLCGHATLAAAWVLWREQSVTAPILRFTTRSGELTAERIGDGVRLNFPLTPTEPLLSSAPLRTLFPSAQAFAVAGEDWLVELASEADIPSIAALPCRGIIITAQAVNKPYQITSRFFAPRFGINEDPVTGSMHCALIDYWGKQLGVTQLQARQASVRGGLLQVARKGERVELWGQAVVTMAGVLYAVQTQ
jgi:predicted PhzF superfamily epimerase YddE/YHI9